MRLRPVTFRYSPAWLEHDPEIQDRQYYNFIAQEFGEVFPQAVNGSGEYLEGDPGEILQLDTYPAQVVAISAIQELIGALDEKESEIDYLRRTTESLQRRLEALERRIGED